MSLSTICPNCQASYNLADTLRGKKVRCKKCQEEFLAEATPANKKNAVREAVNEDQAAETRTANKDNNVKPLRASAARRRRGEIDDDEETNEVVRPAGKKSKTMLPLLLLGLGGGAVILLVLCAGGIGVAVWKLTGAADTTSHAGGNTDGSPLPKDIQAPPDNTPPGPKPGLGSISLVKAATVKISHDPQKMFTERVVVASGGRHVGVCYQTISDPKNVHWFYLFDVVEGKLLNRFELKDVKVAQQMALSPDGSRLAVSEMVTNQQGKFEGAITIWSLPDGQVSVSRWKPFPGGTFNNGLVYLTFLDSNHLLTLTTGRQLAVWDLQGKAQYSMTYALPPGRSDLLMEDPYTKQPKNFALSPDRSRLALFNGAGFDLIDTATGQVRGKTMPYVTQPAGTSIYGVGLNKDGTRLAVYLAVHTLPDPDPVETVSFWDFKTNQAVGSFRLRVKLENSNRPHWGGNMVSWSATGQVFLWGGNRQGLIVDAANGTIYRELEGPQYGAYGFGDVEGRLWYNLVLPGQTEAVLCAVVLPPEELKRDTGLVEGKYYKRWWLNRNGIENQAEKGDSRVTAFLRVGPFLGQ